MMKSAMIKDFYSEIDRLKQAVYAAREKNGIYIPRDRYLQEEAEKKVYVPQAMAEMIEHMELHSDSKDKQIAELQELYNSQLNLTPKLSENHERTEVLNELFGLEEKHRHENATIKEKEFLIANLLKSEKALVERSFGLRAELENDACMLEI